MATATRALTRAARTRWRGTTWSPLSVATTPEQARAVAMTSTIHNAHVRKLHALLLLFVTDGASEDLEEVGWYHIIAQSISTRETAAIGVICMSV